MHRFLPEFLLTIPSEVSLGYTFLVPPEIAFEVYPVIYTGLLSDKETTKSHLEFPRIQILRTKRRVAL